MTPTSAKPAASTGLSLHIGVNALNPRHYGGFDVALRACELDAADLSALAEGAGMKTTVLAGSKATRAKVLTGIRKAAGQLAAGDLFLLSFSGYGGQLPDQLGRHDDQQHKTWCLFDGQLIEDELFAEFAKLPAAVRVIVLADCSHSGTVSRAAPLFSQPDKDNVLHVRMMPPATSIRTYTQNRTFYDKLQKDLARAKPPGLPVIIVLSAAQDNQLAAENDRNGEFTSQLLAVWKEGAFTGNYTQFLAAIRGRMPPNQSPDLNTVGVATRFLKERPFLVASSLCVTTPSAPGPGPVPTAD